jgi:hypothetical protein
MKNKFTRSDIKKFIHGRLNNQLLNEQVELLGNKINIADGALIFNDKKFELSSSGIGIDITDMSMEGEFLSVTIKPPKIWPISDGVPVTALIKDQNKRDELLDKLKKGVDFEFEVINKDGEEKKINFSATG